MSKSDKSVLAESKRSKRLLQLLPGKRVLLQQSTKENTLLLVIAGERTVKCHASTVAKWLSAGYVEIRAHSDGGEAHLISITDIEISFFSGLIETNKLSALLLLSLGKFSNKFWCKSMGIRNEFSK